MDCLGCDGELESDETYTTDDSEDEDNPPPPRGTEEEEDFLTRAVAPGTSTAPARPEKKQFTKEAQKDAGHS